ncbi:MAG: Gfo/Idh/MocA family protein [Promethearchaeota archaeon]
MGGTTTEAKNANTKTKPRLKLGMVGHGLNAWVHLTELRFAPRLRGRTETVAILEPNPQVRARLERKRRYRDGVNLASSLDEFLDTPGLQAAIISSPPQFHADQVVACLEAGLHVYSEVPMALTREDVERIVDAVEQSGKVYQLGENYAFLREVMFAGHLVASGKIGPAVYAESEYLHDVTYRWREGKSGDERTPRVDSWYSLFDPLMYAHSIGPAQVALGGIDSPVPFVEVKSYANSIGGYEGNPVCRPAEAFHVALFRTESGAVAKCANAYVFAREPMRLTVQVTGRLGTYECYRIGKRGRLFLAHGHEVSKSITHRRKGKVKRIGRRALSEAAPARIGGHHGSNTRVKDDWLSAIERGVKPKMHALVAANACLAGIAASESARTNRNIEISDFTSRA